MIDPVTGSFEMAEIQEKCSLEIANKVELHWLNRYPHPTTLIYDRGGEFMKAFATMINDDYGIERKSITTRNPQANAILARHHVTIGNIIRTFEFGNIEQDKQAFEGILGAVMYSVRATVHKTTNHTPMQLVFGRDAIFNIKHIIDWKEIHENKKRKFKEITKKKTEVGFPILIG